MSIASLYPHRLRDKCRHKLGQTHIQHSVYSEGKTEVSILNISNYGKADAKILKKKESFLGCLVLLITYGEKNV